MQNSVQWSRWLDWCSWNKWNVISLISDLASFALFAERSWCLGDKTSTGGPAERSCYVCASHFAVSFLKKSAYYWWGNLDDASYVEYVSMFQIFPSVDLAFMCIKIFGYKKDVGAVSSTIFVCRSSWSLRLFLTTWRSGLLGSECLSIIFTEENIEGMLIAHYQLLL